MKKVLVTEQMHDSGMSLLHARSDIEVLMIPDTKPETLVNAVKDVHAIAVRLAALPEDLLVQADKLEIVSRHGVGCDKVAVDHMTRRGLPVAIASGANARSVSEHTMMLMLATARRLLEQDTGVRSGNYKVREHLVATDLHGANVLIIGFGRVGRKLAPLCRAFGMNVTVADIEQDRDLADQMGCLSVEDFRPELPYADFVSLHIPLDDSTRHLMSSTEFNQMKAGGILINCARGGVVDEAAVIKALDGDKLAAFGTDVFEEEPTPENHPLFSRSDVVLTPHTGAASFGSLRASAEMTAQNIIDHFDGCLRDDCIFNTDVIPNLKPSL